ncbi:MAG: hypothetical protein LIV24_03055 [Eubacterium sp.]|nr:hypothetical protein [Eubacterium sp.]
MSEAEKTKRWTKEAIIDLLIVIMLGVTAVTTAWASWIGSLHGGNQATNYAKSNNLASEGNSEYNAAVQQLSYDESLWNDIADMQLTYVFAKEKDDTDMMEQTAHTLLYKMQDNLTEEMAAKIDWNTDLSQAEYDDPVGTIDAWLDKDNAMTSPFDQDFIDSYFDKANELLAESQDVLEQGQKDNSNGDAFGLVSVLYSITLFLLGIAGSFSNRKHKYAIVAISMVSFILGTIYMCTIPMPTGFSLGSFFSK